MKLRQRIRNGLAALAVTTASLLTIVPAQDAAAGTCSLEVLGSLDDHEATRPSA